MPTEMDFEKKYEAGAAEPFDQKNEMFKRALWEEDQKYISDGFNGVIELDGKNGAHLENVALRNAAWSIEGGYARGVEGPNFGLFRWSGRAHGVCAEPQGAKLDASDPERAARIVKQVGKFFGASLVGICKYDQRWVYSKGFKIPECEEFEIKIPDEAKYVIVLATEMEYKQIKFSPSFQGSASVGLGYSQMAIVAGMLAQFLRRIGYSAIPTGNDTAMSIPYAVQAGLGELGRNGILVTPKYGPRVRLCKVFTDLPLAYDKPIQFGVKEFCDACKKCADLCPGQAIPDGERTKEGPNKSNSHGPLKWYVDGRKCYEFWGKSRCDCGVCIRVCPFNKPKGRLHDVSRFLIERFPQLGTVFLKVDNLCGYGKQTPIEKFWNEK